MEVHRDATETATSPVALGAAWNIPSRTATIVTAINKLAKLN